VFLVLRFLFAYSSRILFFVMDATLAPVARSDFPDTIGPKKSHTIVSVFKRGEEHQSMLGLKSCEEESC
jgi:hypothetical protein